MKTRSLSIGLGILCGLLLATTQAADPNSPVGKWKTIDDKSGKPKSIIQITESNGVLTGKIVELLEGAAEKNVQQVRRRSQGPAPGRHENFVGFEEGRRRMDRRQDFQPG